MSGAAAVTAGSMSQAEYARFLGITEGAVSRAIQSGRLPLRPDGRVQFADAEATLGRRHRQRIETRQLTAETEAKRERALLQSTQAKIAMTRRRFEELRSRLIDTNRSQASLGALVDRLFGALATLADDASEDAPLLREALALIMADLGDLHGEALKVTRR